jgi:MYXO-CTERM domain-containing protein
MSSNTNEDTVAFALAIVMAWISGCGGQPAAEVVSTSRPIQGGINDDTHLFAVGVLGQTSRGTALCSGALLAPNLVAIARHCVAALPANGLIACPNTQFGALTPASNIIVTTDADVRTDSTRFAVSQVILPSGADQTSVCGHDIALLILSQNISLPEYVTPVLSPPMTDHALYSTTVTAIGYGLSSPTDTAGTTAGIRRIKEDIKLNCIPNDTSFTDCFPAMAPEMTAAEFVSGDGTCEGDSGSNAFEQANFDAGKWVSFGVLSRGGSVGGNCVGGIYSRFDAWSSLIIDAAAQAAGMGCYPLPPWAARDGGSDTGSSSSDGGPSSGSAGSCARDADASPGSDAGGAEGGASSGSGDAAPSNADAGVIAEGGSIGNERGRTPPGGGCSCATASDDGSGREQWPAAMVGLAAALAALARRRRVAKYEMSRDVGGSRWRGASGLSGDWLRLTISVGHAGASSSGGESPAAAHFPRRRRSRRAGRRSARRRRWSARFGSGGDRHLRSRARPNALA